MLERALTGSQRYYRWLMFLLVFVGMGFAAYLYQLHNGLSVTGMSRDVSWGFYIAQFTFFVGVAASAVMVVLPYYLHNVKVFGRITILGEFLAVASVTICLLFIIVDLGKPMRLLNVLLYPTPNSILFWDMIVLNGYLFLNIVIGWNVLEAERKGVHYPDWVKPLIYTSIPWAVSIHTVTAFLYAGLPGRHYWLTAIMAARFLASAFASGPALLILLAMIVKKYSKFDAGKEAIDKLSQIVTYAMLISIFFVALEFFTAFYSNIPSHKHSLEYLFVGLEGHKNLVPFMWMFVILAIVAIVLLLNPKTRTNEKTLRIACISVFASMWLEKGLGLVVAGFIPNPFDQVREYAPTIPELTIAFGVWATGILVLTILYKIAVSVKEEVA
ncbi:sulfate reduction electron transfer complex DsrMKJOP subunit DsrP [Desulforhabdus amnigena]|uniref:Hdr menaquinol oxidoreductase integral membrane subunit n=1 Tax=Desulforhabdus amnigena TaxID=40218 RepID=A0A9W6D1F2_9BACT|nr:NrfD/PsrC family molybdoenzyme membrane anchor subunit [Desulforhabdus amnigena]NLJ29180.1 polysulfide reductase NrfD [Deltaproteobacteria bacterium]GLI32873.1 Hdr menaquinol oxidoreductase integral membrane subunit [Desulforhabdus amnigena]